MSIVKIFNLFNSLSFKVFKKSKLLIIVDDYRQKYPLKHAEYFCARKIYIYYLIISILKFGNIKKNYFNSIFNAVNFKIIISNNLNIFSYNFKKFSINSKLIFFQHNYIYNFKIENYKNLYRDIKLDYFCVFDQKHKNIFSKIIESNFIKIGSFNNNFIDINENIKFKKQINYISEYRGKKQTNNSILSEKKIIKKLYKFCSDHGFKLLVSLVSNRIDKTINKKDEINYFLSIVKGIQFNDNNSYQNSFESSLTIVMSSNIGIELICRGIPTLYTNELKKMDPKFDNPYYINFPNIFVDIDLSDDKFATKILKIIAKKKHKLHIPIKYDKGNFILNEVLKSL